MSVSISLVRTLVDAVERAGVSPESYLRAAGVPATLLDDVDARVEIPLYDRLGELAIAMTRNPGLGLVMGERAPIDAYHLVGQIAAQCPTLRDALPEIARFHRLVADTAEPPRLVEEGDRARLVYDYVRSTPVCNRLRAEFGMARIRAIGARFFGDDNWPLEVWFEHERPDHADQYRRIFGGVELFEMPETALVFSRRLVDRAQRHHDSRLVDVLRERAEYSLRRLESEVTCAERVRDFVMSQGRAAKVSVTFAARRLGLTPRTLQRRLAAEATSFQEVVNEARAEVARRILAEAKTTTQEAAFRMGFSDVSAFHRAFRRWTGMTPAHYRSSLERTSQRRYLGASEAAS